jgi:PAS domain S-box-containing protein
MKDLLLEIIFNLSLLTTLTVTSNLFYDYFYKNKKLLTLSQGLLFGAVGFIVVKYPFVLQDGLSFDGKPIVISICSFLYGPLAGLIASIPPLVLRINIGGIGVLMHILFIVISFIVGSYFHYKYKNHSELELSQFLILGFFVNLLRIPVLFTLPENLHSLVLKNIVPVFLIGYTTVTLILGLVLIYPRKLKAEKEKLEYILDNLNDAVLIVSEGKFVYVNNYSVRIFEAENKEDLVFRPFMQLVHPIYHEFISENIKKVYEGNLVLINHYKKAITLKKNIKDVLVNPIPIIYNGKQAMLVQITDVTEQYRNRKIQDLLFEISTSLITSKNINEFITQLRSSLSKLIDTKNFFIALYDERTKILQTSIEWDEKDTGPEKWPAKGSITGRVVELKKTLKLSRSDLEHLINNGEIQKIGEIPEIWLGVPLIFNNKVFGVMVFQDYQNPNAFYDEDIKLLENISQQLSLYIHQKLVQERLNIMSRAVENAQVSIFITNKNGIIEYVNNKCVETTGYNKDELLGKNPRILKSGYHSKEFYKNLWDTIKTGNDWSGEIINKRKNGEIYFEKTLITPIKNEKGEITHFISLKEDVTQLNKLIKDLKEAKEVAEESVRIMRNFLSMMSHEIRTPMNVILGYLALIRDEFYYNCEDEVKQWFERIESASERLLNSATNILDAEKLEMGEFVIHPKIIDLNEQVSKIFNQLEIQAKRKGINFIKNTIGMPLPILADGYTLDGIIYNLINNAIKFTNEGEVEVTTSLEEEKVKFMVRDTGIGMSEEYKKHLFKIFSQEEVGFARSFEGTGLGLYLVKKFVELNKGEIKVNSIKGKGTTFEVLFDLAKQV